MLHLASKLFDYEAGQLSARDQLNLFAELIQTGLAWKLQGSYARMAAGWIDAGYITAEGHITDFGYEACPPEDAEDAEDTAEVE